MRYIISYDITDAKRLKEVAKALQNMAWRMQKSVFMAIFTETEFEAARKKLLSLIDQENDSLLFFPICKRCHESTIALGIEEFQTKSEMVMVL